MDLVHDDVVDRLLLDEGRRRAKGSVDVTDGCEFDNYRYMGTAAEATVAMFRRAADARVTAVGGPPDSALEEFERIYLGNVEVVIAYFARRCPEPQLVADLTSETFVRAVGAFGSFDPGRGSPRAWLFGIAANVYARHCSQSAAAREAAVRLAGQRALDPDEIDELAERIDAERAGRELIERGAWLPELERAAVELVDISGLKPKEAAMALGVSGVVLRKRLSRARARLREEHHSDE
jgi:RNA polymerase sigma factor (sigma-70 family)